MRKKIRSEQSETLKKVLRYLKRYWFFLALSFGLAAITVASTLYIPLLTGDAVDCVIGKGQVDFTGIFAVLKRMAMVIGVTAVAQWGMNICNNKMTYQIVRDIRNEAFAKLEILPLKYLDGHPSGEVVSRIIADVDQFADGIYPAVYGCAHDCGNHRIHAECQCRDHAGCAFDHAGVYDRGLLYCKENIYHVPTAVGGERGTDGTDR